MSRPAWIDDLDPRAAARSGLLLAVGPHESAACVAAIEAGAGPVLVLDGLGVLWHDFAEVFDPRVPGRGQWLPASIVSWVESQRCSAAVDLSGLPGREAAGLAALLLEEVEELPEASRPVLIVAGPERLLGDYQGRLEALVLLVERSAELDPLLLRRVKTVMVSGEGADAREQAARARLVDVHADELAELPAGVVVAEGPAVRGRAATWVPGEERGRRRPRVLGWLAGAAAVVTVAAVAPTVGVLAGAVAGAVLGVGALVSAARR